MLVAWKDKILLLKNNVKMVNCVSASTAAQDMETGIGRIN